MMDQNLILDQTLIMTSTLMDFSKMENFTELSKYLEKCPQIQRDRVLLQWQKAGAVISGNAVGDQTHGTSSAHYDVRCWVEGVFFSWFFFFEKNEKNVYWVEMCHHSDILFIFQV